ncbi:MULTISPECIES: PspA/IM30 family protein [Ruminococcus]|jgi:phage shock protein A|uniref:Phage shock protein A (PspA) family protein n=1 Tax=Ruminococcus flavefaciens TaxID=1265 RepID=A0A315Y2D3_RUMFL|nr:MULTISPECIES: PspA/IM30 family protein [Ruminococcus]MBQ6170596.1 PspA/IM30 family protein [Ruminococcus sp.]MBR1431564.1 PspA/IM30 family protein [Ruminococcus sp.]PWJ13588.1 phage shock protein A (PspA) family protein [Ruminococcus flavefaciens]SSA48147.1 phage shock protein A (PspA) family protein [Ruminococcus flavefaciens]
MGVFQRLSDLLKSNVNDLIDRAEDPEKMVKQIIIDMQTELTKATQNYGKAKASERLAEKKYLEAQKISSDWEAKAKMALSKGDQELAKQALARKVKADEDLNNYKEMYESISAQTDAIGDQVEVLRAKLEEAKSRQAMLIARSQMAETKKNLAKAAGGFDGNSSLEKFQKMEEKIERKEAEADAFTEIAGNNLAGGSGDDLRDSFEKLESDAKVDAELQRLMAEMNGGASAQNAE